MQTIILWTKTTRSGILLHTHTHTHIHTIMSDMINIFNNLVQGNSI